MKIVMWSMVGANIASFILVMALNIAMVAKLDHASMSVLMNLVQLREPVELLGEHLMPLGNASLMVSFGVLLGIV